MGFTFFGGSQFEVTLGKIDVEKRRNNVGNFETSHGG